MIILSYLLNSAFANERDYWRLISAYMTRDGTTFFNYFYQYIIFIKEQKKRTRDGTNVRVSHDLGQTGSQRLTSYT